MAVGALILARVAYDVISSFLVLFWFLLACMLSHSVLFFGVGDCLSVPIDLEGGRTRSDENLAGACFIPCTLFRG